MDAFLFDKILTHFYCLTLILDHSYREFVLWHFNHQAYREVWGIILIPPVRQDILNTKGNPSVIRGFKGVALSDSKAID